jgi:hypothetical protein
VCAILKHEMREISQNNERIASTDLALLLLLLLSENFKIINFSTSNSSSSHSTRFIIF